MEFLLVNHPLDCPICDQGGECDLQVSQFTVLHCYPIISSTTFLRTSQWHLVVTKHVLLTTSFKGKGECTCGCVWMCGFVCVLVQYIH